MNNGYVNELLKARGNLQLFRSVIHRIAGFLSLKYVEEYHCSDKTVLMTVLRAGIALERSFLKRIFPAPQLHYIRTKRDPETLKAKVLDKTFGENCEKADTDAVLILEPMLATGGTMEVVINEINKAFKPEQVFIISVFVSKIAEETIGDKATIIALSKGHDLNDRGYILITDPYNTGEIVTLDLGDEYCGTNSH